MGADYLMRSESPRMTALGPGNALRRHLMRLPHANTDRDCRNSVYGLAGIACSVACNFAQQMRQNVALSQGARLAGFDPNRSGEISR
jgi:hypothetical protein